MNQIKVILLLGVLALSVTCNSTYHLELAKKEKLKEDYTKKMKKQWKKEFEDSIKASKEFEKADKIKVPEYHDVQEHFPVNNATKTSNQTAEAFHDNSAAQWTAEMNQTLIKTSEAAVDLAKKTKKMAIQTEQTVQDMAKRSEAAAAKTEQAAAKMAVKDQKELEQVNTMAKKTQEAAVRTEQAAAKIVQKELEQVKPEIKKEMKDNEITESDAAKVAIKTELAAEEFKDKLIKIGEDSLFTKGKRWLLKKLVHSKKAPCNKSDENCKGNRLLR